MNNTTAYGLTMRWTLSRNHFGKRVIHGWIGNEQRMSCELLSNRLRRRPLQYSDCEKVVIDRLRQIAAEGQRGGRKNANGFSGHEVFE